MSPSLRSLGKDELFFTLRNSLGYYHNVALSISLTLYRIPEKDFLRFIYAALACVVEKYPILFAVPVIEIGPESVPELSANVHPEACFERLPYIKLSDVVSVVVRDGALLTRVCQNKAETTFDVEHDLILQKIHNVAFEQRQAQWRILVHRDTNAVSTDADISFSLAFVYHHALGDGLSGLAFLEEFVAALARMMRRDKECGDIDVLFAKDEALLPPLECWKRAARVAGTSQEQRQELEPSNHSLPSTNLWLGTEPLNTLPLTSRFTSFTISSRTTQTLLSTVSEHKTSLTPLLQTLLTATIFSAVREDFDRILGLCSLSLRPYLDALPEGAIGLFIAGSRTEYLRGQFHCSGENVKCGGYLTMETDFWNEVDRTKRSLLASINKAVEALPISKPGPIHKGEQNSMLSWMKSLIKAPRVASFDLNNLGKFDAGRLDDSFTTLEASGISLGRVVFSASQNAIGSALKVNVITGPRGEMTFGFAWQNEVHDEQIVRNIVDIFRREIELI